MISSFRQNIAMLSISSGLQVLIIVSLRSVEAIERMNWLTPEWISLTIADFSQFSRVCEYIFLSVHFREPNVELFDPNFVIDSWSCCYFCNCFTCSASELGL